MCPTCRVICKPTRNMGVEKVLECLEVTLPCPHEDCHERVQYSDFFNHKYTCRHRPIRYNGRDIPPSKFLQRLYETTANLKAEPMVRIDKYAIQLSYPPGGSAHAICKVGLGLHLYLSAYPSTSNVVLCAYSTSAEPFDIEVLGPLGQLRYTVHPETDIREYSKKIDSFDYSEKTLIVTAHNAKFLVHEGDNLHFGKLVKIQIKC